MIRDGARWFEADDDTITEIDEERVHDAQVSCYILFYQLKQ